VNRALHPEADAEFLEAVRHYAEIAPELGGRFYDEISGLMYDVCLHPGRHRTFDPPVRPKPRRRIFAMKFPANDITTLRSASSSTGTREKGRSDGVGICGLCSFELVGECGVGFARPRGHLAIDPIPSPCNCQTDR